MSVAEPVGYAAPPPADGDLPSRPRTRSRLPLVAIVAALVVGIALAKLLEWLALREARVR